MPGTLRNGRTVCDSTAGIRRVACCILFAACISLLHARPAGAQTTGLHGTVTADDEPLANVRVLVVEMDRAVFTREDGSFALPSLPAGEYTVEFDHAGYATELVTITAATRDPLHVEMRWALQPLAPLTVTVTRAPLAPELSPVSAASVGPDALQRTASISLARAVNRVPGVRNLSTGQEIGKPVIRGLTGPRVLVLSDGLRLENYAWSDEDGPTIDPAMAERIEIVRGPAAVAYGADAVGGVVNVIPRPLPDAAGGDGFVRGELELAAHTNNREADLVLRTDGAAGAWGWRALATGRKAESLQTPVGELENTGFEALTGEAAIVRRAPWGSLTARYVRYGGEFRLLEEDGPPRPENGNEPLEEGPERKLEDDRFQLLGIFPFSHARLETRLQAQRHHLIELEDDPEALREGRFVEVEIFDLMLQTALGEALLHHSLADDLHGTVGITGKLQRSTTDGVVPLVPDAAMRAAGVFVVETLARGPFTITAGIRADLDQLDAEAHDARTFGAVNGSLGAAWVVGAASITANVGTAWRAPSLFELYAAGPRLGEARYEIGDQNLDVEHSLNLDVGVHWLRGRLRADLTAFDNEFRGFLFIQPTDEVRDEYRVYRYDQARARIAGAEAALHVSVLPWLALNGSGEFVHGTNLDRAEPLPLMPPARLIADAELHGHVSWADRAFVSVQGEFVLEPGRLNPLDTPVDGYELLHVLAGVEGHLASHDARIDVGVRNALDAAYRDFLSRYKSFALNPGRDVVIRLRTTL